MVKVHDLPSCSSNNAGATSSASSVVATSGICHGATVSSTAIRAQKPRTNLRATLVQQQQGPGAPPPGASAAITPHFHHVHQPWTTFAEALPPGAPPPGSGAPATFHFGPGFQPQHQHHGQHEHVVHFHVNPGVTVNFQIGESMQRISGPVTVPMVSTNPSPPIAMPVQVPPGHMVQQIVDESGTLRHVILSPQHQHQHMVPLQPPPHQHQNQPHYGPGNGSPQPHQPFFPQAMPAGYGPPPMPAYGLALAPPTHTGHSSPPPPSQQQQQHQQSHQYFKDERAQRQRIRLKRKMEMRQPRGGLVNSNAAGALNAHKELVNGLKRGMTKDQGMNSVGTSEDGEESSSVQEDEEAITEILSSVQPPRVTELTSRSALLQWLVPQRITEPLSDANEPEVPESELLYKVLLSTDRGKEGKYKSIYSGKSLSCRVEDLRPGQEYAVCVQVNWDEIHGCASEPTAFKTPACEPDQPQPPKLISRGRSSLQLRWSAAADNGSHILCYILEYDEGRGGGSFVELARGKAKQHTLQRLQTDTCYQFRLAAVNECGQSSYSSVVAFSTTGCPPPQPLPPMLREATSSSLHLHWCKRQDADDNFILQMDDKHSRHGFLPVYNGKDVEYVYRGLQRATQFWFRLQAQNEEGSSQWSEEVCYNTLPERPAKPPKPIVKGRVHSYQFRVKWDPPSDRGGADITNYMVEISTSGGVNNLLYSGPDTETMCDRLTPGTIYQVRVSCASPGGRSDWSDPCTVMTEAVCPAECGSPYLAAKPRATSIAVTWQYPQYDGGAIISDFELEITHPDGTQCIVYKGNATEFIVNNLSPGQNYVFRVRALNRVGQGPWSEVLSVTSEAAAPDAPEKPEVNAKSPFSIYVQWKEPQCHGAPVSEYRLEIGSSDRDENFSSIFQGGSTSYEVKGLTPFTSYFFRVQACNSAGCSPFSPIAVTLTPASVPSGILTPKYESTPTNVTLYWSEPQNNGAEILHYNIEIGEKLISTEEPVTEYVLENLTPDTTYKIKIQAVNIIGSGPFSSTVRVTTLPPPPPPPILECVGIGHNYLKLKWGDGKNIDFTRYCVEIDNRKLKEFQCIYQGTGYTYKVNKLQECTTYRFRVAAETDAAGPGDWSDVYEFVTSVAPPPCPKMLKTVEVTQKSCTVEWAPCRLTSTDPIFYVLQLTRVRDQDYKQVYKGQDTKYTMTELEPSAEYSVRVCAVRQAASGELPGSYVQTNFSTPTAESASNQRLTCTTPVTSSPSRGRKTQRTLVPSWFPGSHDDRPMSDKQKTLLLVILFGGFAILSGMLVESFINWRQSSV